MERELGAKQILETAKRIEQRGSAFYQAAAEMVSLPDSRQVLLDLAKMEEGHGEVFDRLIADLDRRKEEGPAPDPETLEYLQAIAANHILLSMKGPQDCFSSHTPVRDVLRIALQAEFASIAFFQGMLEFLSPGFGRDQIRTVIFEEQEHVVIINKRIIAFASAARQSI